MPRIKTKLDNKTSTWTANIRPRVGASTVYNGYYWSNVTGINSEPGVGQDWTKIGAIEAGVSTGFVTLEDYPGYKVDKVGKPNVSQAESGDIFYGQGAFFEGEYVIVKVMNDNPADDTDFHEPFIQSI